MTARRHPSLGLKPVDLDDGLEDEGPIRPLLPPDDRLWRHPSELRSSSGQRASANPRNSSGWAPGRVWAVAVVAGVVGALTASGVGILSGAFDQQTTVVRSVSPEGPSLTLAADTGNGVSALDWTAVDDAIAPSVVAIQVSGGSGPATGSGTLMVDGEASSYVITDSSLVAGGGSITVSYLSGDTVRGKLVGTDFVSGLALIAVPNRKAIFPAFGTVAELREANPVLAVGARVWPGGSVFAGSISGEDREVDVAGGLSMQNMIAMTSPAIPASAAGGPLVDSRGRVVGVTVAVDPTDPTDQGLTFAVPIDVAQLVCQQLLSNSKVQHPWLGISDAVDLTSAVARQMGLTGGAQIGTVWPGSPASRAGLGPNDVITALDGAPVTSSGALTRLLSQDEPGKVVKITYIRDGSSRTGTLVVTDQPDGN